MGMIQLRSRGFRHCRNPLMQFSMQLSGSMWPFETQRRAVFNFPSAIPTQIWRYVEQRTNFVAVNQ